MKALSRALCLVSAMVFVSSVAQTIVMHRLADSSVYDDAGRLTAIDYPTGTDVVFSYDDSGRLVSMSDSTGATSWTYDAVSQLTLLETPQAEISYSYNDAGQLISMDHEGVGVTEYEYDDDGRLVSLTNPFEETTSFVYDDASRLTRKNLANGVYELYSYDNRSRLIGIQIKNSAHSLIDSHSYDYDAVSNIVERTSGGVTTEFGYDLVGQLISETRSGYSASYTYDANGNRLTRTVNSVTEEYEYDGADKLLEVSIGEQAVKEFTYDPAGRTTSVTTSAGTTSLTWDYQDRLVGITYPNTSSNSFSYNAFGARVSKTDSSGTSTYARNGTSVVAPVLGDGSLTYTPGISSRDGNNSTWSHADIKNSLRQSSENESTTATKHYDAFGNETSSSGTWRGPFQYGGPFGYQSDSDSNLKLLGHRYYDSSTGRFLSSDRIGHGRNWYSYCRNNPVEYVDPNGLAIIQVRYRHVALGGYHAYIVVIDENNGGKSWAISAGQTNLKTDFYPGDFKRGHYDYRADHIRHPRVTIVNDDLPAEFWIDQLSRAAKELESDQVDYWPLPYALFYAKLTNANSNTAARELLDRTGLQRPKDHPVWVPRWNDRWPGQRKSGPLAGWESSPSEDPTYDPYKKPWR